MRLGMVMFINLLKAGKTRTVEVMFYPSHIKVFKLQKLKDYV